MMAKRRVGNKKKRLERQNRRRAKRNEQMVSVLSALNIRREFHGLPAKWREDFLKVRYKKPAVVFADTEIQFAATSNIRSDILSALGACDIEIKGSKTHIGLVEFLCIGVALWNRFGKSAPNPTGHAGVDRFQQCLHNATGDHFRENIDVAIKELVSRSEKALLKYSRIDTRLFWLSFDFYPDTDQSCVVHAVVHAHQAQVERRVIGNHPKRLFRCGAGYQMALEWVSWTPADVESTGDHDALPVFIDGHTLKNFRDRVTIAQDSGEVDDFMWQSLRSPTVTRRMNDDEFLVEYRLLGYRIGHFVFKRLEDLFAAKTFLFLTMNGTPEGDKLWKTLRLTKQDKKCVGLDKLSTFLLSDIKDDRQLVSVFEHCGIGHLFKMTDETLRAQRLRGTAADVREYLKTTLDRAVKRLRSSAK